MFSVFYSLHKKEIEGKAWKRWSPVWFCSNASSGWKSKLAEVLAKKGEICLNLMRSFMFDDDHEDLQFFWWTEEEEDEGWISQLLLFPFKRRNSKIDYSRNPQLSPSVGLNSFLLKASLLLSFWMQIVGPGPNLDSFESPPTLIHH